MTVSEDIDRAWASISGALGEDFELPNGAIVKGVWAGRMRNLPESAVRAGRFQAKFATAAVAGVRAGQSVVRKQGHVVMRVNEITPDRFGLTWLSLSAA